MTSNPSHDTCPDFPPPARRPGKPTDDIELSNLQAKTAFAWHNAQTAKLLDKLMEQAVHYKTTEIDGKRLSPNNDAHALEKAVPFALLQKVRKEYEK